MSENRGKCRTCGGSGEIETVVRDFILMREVRVTQKCGRCGGAGDEPELDEHEIFSGIGA